MCALELPISRLYMSRYNVFIGFIRPYRSLLSSTPLSVKLTGTKLLCLRSY